jgi:hypothetical protein
MPSTEDISISDPPDIAPRSNPSIGTNTTSPTPSPAHHTHTGAIVGGVVGGVVGLICLALLAFLAFRRRSGQKRFAQAGPVHEMPEQEGQEQKQQQQQKYYEMESPAVEMPADNQDTLEQKLKPSSALQELDSSGDQNVRQKPASTA